MDGIHYQLLEDAYLTEDIDDEMELGTTTIEYGNIEMIVDFDAVLRNQTT